MFQIPQLLDADRLSVRLQEDAVGKMVLGQGSDGAPLSGVVERVLVEGKDVNLLVNGREMALADVREIMAAPAAGSI